MEKKKMKIPVRFIALAAVCSLFLFSGCAASKNMLAAIFGGNSGNEIPFHAASDEQKNTINPDTSYQLARHFQESGKHQLAVAELLKVVKADPEHAKAYNALGVSYDRLREFDLAAVSYREALKIDPGLDYVYNNIGYSFLLQGNLEAAARAVEKAVALNSEKQLYQNNLALVYARLGRDVTDHVAAVQQAKEAKAGVTSLPAVDSETAGEGESLTAAESVSAVAPATAAESVAAVTSLSVEESVSTFKPVSAIEPLYTATDADEPAAGVSEDGSAAVSDDASATASAGAAMQDVYYTVQLGVYYDIDKALSAVKDAQDRGYQRPYITRVERDGPYEPYFRVRFGKYTSREQAAALAAEIPRQNWKSVYVASETGAPENIYAMADVKFNDMDVRPTIIKTNHDIEILNGNGVQNMARGMRQYLTRQGFTVSDIANAPHFNHPRTIIYYSPGYYAEAQKLLAQLNKIQPAGKIVESKNLNKKIQIVLGRDFKPAAAKLRKNS